MRANAFCLVLQPRPEAVVFQVSRVATVNKKESQVNVTFLPEDATTYPGLGA